MRIKARLLKIAKKLEPKEELAIIVWKEGDPPLSAEIERTITMRFVVGKDDTD